MIRAACLLLVLLPLLACQQETSHAESQAPAAVATDNSTIQNAFLHKQSHVMVIGHGTVIKLLADDTQGARHQRFLLRINARQTLLFAHNIDLATRLPLKVGDIISFKGEYIYNPKGGIVHWTHHDPQQQHEAGWIKVNTRLFD